MKLTTAESDGQLEEARTLFKEYEAATGVDLCFQNFAQELAALPGDYARPAGRLLLAYEGDEPAGCVALRRIDAEVCEMKRLYVRVNYRGTGLGRTLAEAIVALARDIGYARVRLDTLPTMHSAIALYRSLGFREIKAYRFSPIDGTLYMELELR